MTRDVFVSALPLYPLERALAVSEAARAHICWLAKKFCNIFTGSKPWCMRANAWATGRACDVHLATEGARMQLGAGWCVPSQMHAPVHVQDTHVATRLFDSAMYIPIYVFPFSYYFCICIGAQQVFFSLFLYQFSHLLCDSEKKNSLHVRFSLFRLWISLFCKGLIRIWEIFVVLIFFCKVRLDLSNWIYNYNLGINY